MNSELKGIVRELHKRFEDLYGERLSRLVLFGSQARGDAEPGSDIDLLVVLNGPVTPTEEIERTIDEVADISLNHNVVVSCVFVPKDRFEHEQSPLLLNVRKEGVTL
jgi:predicted nucleotidyltransferase